MKDEAIRFLQLVCIFTDLVPKILLDVLTYHITLSKAFRKRFGENPWDGGQENRAWLATVMRKNPRVQDFSCAAVKNTPGTEWDVTNLIAALSVVMEPSAVPCDVAVTQACSRAYRPLAYFNVSVPKRRDCKTWEGFSINVTGASPPEVVECVVAEAPSGTQVVAVCRERANDRDLPKKIKKYMATEPRPVHLPLPEVQHIVKVRQSRNTLYHRSKTEVSDAEFTQCVVSVRCLIEQALCPYFPKGNSDSYLAKLEESTDMEDFRGRVSVDRAVLKLFQKALNELNHVMEELGRVGELRLEVGQQREELLREMDLLKTELTSVLERMSHLEGTVCDIQSGQDSLSQRMDRVEAQLEQRPLNRPQQQLLFATLPAPVTEQSPAGLLKEKVYNEYRRFKLEGRKANAEYVKLAVVEKPPSSRPEDVKDIMEATQRFRNCGPRVADEKVKHITPIDLLKKGSERIRIVYGQAGSGKTTLLKQMCKALSCEEGESDFNLVLYFPLRERSVSSARDLQSLLSYYLLDEDPADVSSTVKSLKKNKGLLLVLDGADEVKNLLSPSSGSIVQRILESRTLPDAHVIISSRPGACPSLQDHSACFYEVQGFDRTAITSYVSKFFEGSPAADRMLSQLVDRPDLLGGAYIPMNLFIFCSVFEQSSSFPPTMAACYQVFVRQTIIRECHQKGRELHLDPLLRYTLLPEDICCLLASLGELSFKGLCQVPPMFIFNEYGSTPNEPSIRSTFPQELLPRSAPIEEYLFKGLLRMHASKSGFEPTHSFSFPHGTQQEFLASLHLSNLEEDEQAQFWRDNLFNIFFSVVLRFFAGLTGLRSPQVTKEICTLTGAAEDGSTSHSMGECSHGNPQLLFLCHTLHQSQNVPLTKTVMQRIPTSLEFRLSLSAFDTMAISYCLSQCSHLRLLKLPFPYCTLLSSQCLSHLKAVLQANPQCQLDFGGVLHLSCDHLPADDAQTLSEVAVSSRTLLLSVTVLLMVSHTDCTALSTVCSLPGVKRLDITVRSDVKDDSGWPLVENSLAKNKQLESFQLNGCDSYLLNMVKALTKNTSIPVLCLWRREKPLPDDVACALGTCVAAMTQLRELWMCDLSLPVLKALPERTELLGVLHVNPPGVNWDGFSEDEWKEAEEAVATAKVRRVDLTFDDKSRRTSRAVLTIIDGLVRNEFIREITLHQVPEEMTKSARQTLRKNSGVTHVYVTHYRHGQWV